MILTCPQCASRYFVDDARVGPEGRDVRCASCGNRWRAFPSTMEEPEAVAPSDPLPEPAPRFAPEAQAEPETETVAAPTDRPEVAAASEPAPLSPAYPKPGKKKPGAAGAQKREGAVAALVWAGLAVFLAGILGAAVFYRVEVVRLAPRLASAYAAAGLPVNTVGLVIEQLRAEPSLQDGHAALTVTGVLRNVAGRDVAAPPLRVSLINPTGKRVAGKIAAPADPRVPAGQSRHFAVALIDPPSTAKDLEVGFVLDGAAPALKVAAPPLGGHAEATPHLRGPAGAEPAAAARAEPASAPGVEAHAAPVEHP